uniref:Uncharacterized protein n=1 Tax=Anguilla anguilla TaxID=7936 RepID=A0A0E9S0T4_ANGAN
MARYPFIIFIPYVGPISFIAFATSNSKCSLESPLKPEPCSAQNLLTLLAAKPVASANTGRGDTSSVHGTPDWSHPLVTPRK